MSLGKPLDLAEPPFTYPAPLTHHPPCAKHCLKQFPNINSINGFNNPIRSMLLTFVLQMKGGSERGNHLPKVTQLTTGRARTSTQRVRLQTLRS